MWINKKNSMVTPFLFVFLLLTLLLSCPANAGLVGPPPGYGRFILKEAVVTNSGLTGAGALANANGISLLGTGTSLFIANSTNKIQWQETENSPRQTVGGSSVSIWAEIDVSTNSVLQGRIDIFGDLLGFNGLQYGADLSELVWGPEKIGFFQINHSGNVCNLGFCTLVEELLLFKDLSFNGDFSQSFQIVGKGITTVPLPASAWLLVSGIIGLIGFSRKRGE